MTRTNIREQKTTHEGGTASTVSPELALRRSVMACMLWERTFYESGENIATRIARLSAKVNAQKVANMAITAREQANLRHAPLWLCAALAKQQRLKAETLARVIQRADELAEFLAMYWKDGRCPLSAQVKKGLAAAFPKFDAYSLGKYNRDGQVKLRDVLFLSHAKPRNKQQAETWKSLIDGTLAVPDTWEVGLSGGADKKTTWLRLMGGQKLGAMALLRNLRNMTDVGVSREAIGEALENMKVSRILPFRFVAAAKAVPQLEPLIERAMVRALEDEPELPGMTAIAVDSSGSMDLTLSDKGTMTRFDAACALAIMAREICGDVRVFSYGTQTVEVPARRGFALRDAIRKANSGYMTRMGRCISTINSAMHQYHRVIVITDEQTADTVPAPKGVGYIVNVAAYKNGVGYGNYKKVDGFSAAMLQWVRDAEFDL